MGVELCAVSNLVCFKSMDAEVCLVEALLVERLIDRVQKDDSCGQHCKETLIILFFLATLLDHFTYFDSLLLSDFELHELMACLLKFYR
mgnify:FL=1